MAAASPACLIMDYINTQNVQLIIRIEYGDSRSEGTIEFRFDGNDTLPSITFTIVLMASS